MAGDIELWSLRRFRDVPIRFDWFGNVRRSNHTGALLSYLTMSCSSVSDGGSPIQLPRPPGKQLPSVDIPVNWLGLVRLGDVWKAARRVGSETLERVTFQGLVVDDTTTSDGPCGKSSLHADGVRRHDLPFERFRRHADHTLAYLARVSVAPGLVLLVPSMEIIRFYFGSSGALLGNIFSGAFAKDHLYTVASKNADGVANITLAKNIPAMGAATVARIAFNPVARRQFQSIVNTGVRAAANREPWYPRALFPFQGETDLTADGVWLEGAPERVFLALRLVSCTHPFPFTKLYYKVDAETIAKLIGREAKPPKQGEDQRKSSDVSVRQAPQDTALSPALISRRAEVDPDPFPDLLGKQVLRRKDDAPSRALSQPKPSGGGAEASSVATGPNKDGASRPVEASEMASEPSAEVEEPIALRRLRDASGSTAPGLVIRACAPLPTTRSSTRIELTADDGLIVGVWASMLTFQPEAADAKSLLVLAVEDRPYDNSPDVVAFDLWQKPKIKPALLASMARVFVTHGEDRDHIANEHSLIGSWSSQCFGNGGEAGVLQELLQHVAFVEWGTIDGPSAADPPPVKVTPMQASATTSTERAALFVRMFGHFEEALNRINRRKEVRADLEGEERRSEPDWWALAKHAAAVLAQDDGDDLGAAVDCLCSWFDEGGDLGYGGAFAGAMVGSHPIQRAFMAMRRLRNAVSHRQRGVASGLADSDGEAVAAALLLLRRYLDHDHSFLVEYEETTAI